MEIRIILINITICGVIIMRSNLRIAGLLMVATAGSVSADTVTSKSVIDNYANIAQAGYEDSLTTAQTLRELSLIHI